MANHASTRTTQVYDRREDSVTLDEVERVAIEFEASMISFDDGGPEVNAVLSAIPKRSAPAWRSARLLHPQGNLVQKP